jgi:Asp-tRNA(Asn)/Glu-tRNA(Gln) amidotransferase B subunit
MTLESFQTYFNEATDEEIVQFFSAFTADERNEEFADMFGLISCILRVKDGDDWVHKYFVYRDLIVKEVDTGTLGPALDKIIAANEKAWKEYTGGKEQAVGRFIGQLSKATGVTPQDAKAFIEARKNNL